MRKALPLGIVVLRFWRLRSEEKLFQGFDGREDEANSSFKKCFDSTIGIAKLTMINPDSAQFGILLSLQALRSRASLTVVGCRQRGYVIVGERRASCWRRSARNADR